MPMNLSVPMMATYGKKKRNFLPTFSIFQDEKTSDEGLNKRTIKRKQKDSKLSKKKTTHLVPERDDTIDDLANALLEETLSDAGQTISPTSVPSSFARSSSKSFPYHPRKMDKPLPNISRGHHVRTMSETGLKLSISSPQPLIIGSDVPEAKLQHVHLSPYSNTASTASPATLSFSSTHPKECNPRAFSKASDAAALSTKLSSLMQQAQNQESCSLASDSNNRNGGRCLKAGRTHRLQKGKEAFARATRAIVQRWSSGAESKASKETADNRNSLDTSIDEIAGPEYDAIPETGRLRLHRRIAEGANLGNPKIKNLTGDGKIARKPLPSYKSLQRIKRHASLEDPFSDDKEFADVSDISDISPHPRIATIANAHGPIVSQALPNMTINSSPMNLVQTIKIPTTTISQKQLDDDDIFSSSPIDNSTPRYRLEPYQINANSKTRLSAVHNRQTSAPPLGINNPFSNEVKEKSHHIIEESNLSLKRKKGKEDLRVDNASIPKRVRRKDEIGSEVLPLEEKMKRLDTGDRVALSIKDNNKKAKHGKLYDNKVQGTGLKIFDVPKGKEPMRNVIETVNSIRSGLKTKRSTIAVPMPVASGSGNYQGEKVIKSTPDLAFDEDSLSMDELQMA